MRSGMMLLELIAVLALLIVTVSLSLPVFSVFDRFLVRTELDTLYLTCTALQHEAQLTGKAQELRFIVKEHAYAWGDKRHRLHDAVRFGTVPNVAGPPAAPHAIITHPVTFPGNKIVFYPDGIVQAGAVYLVDKARRFLFALTCPVSHISYMRRYAYQARWAPL